MMESRAQQFVTEAREHLGVIEQLLLALEKGEDAASQREQLDHCLRLVHSLKGDAGFMGLSVIRQLANAMETVLEAMRDQDIAITPASVETLLVARDRLAALTDDLDRSQEVDLSKLLGRLEEIATPHTQTVHSCEFDLSTINALRSGSLAGFFQELQRIGPVATARLSGVPSDLSFPLPSGSIPLRLQASTNLTPTELFRQLQLPLEQKTKTFSEVLPLKIDLTEWADSRRCSLSTLLCELSNAGALRGMQLSGTTGDLTSGLPQGTLVLSGELITNQTAEAIARQLGWPISESAAQEHLSERDAPQPDTEGRPVPSRSASTHEGDKGSTLRVQVELLDRLMTLIGELTLVRNQALLEFGQLNEQFRPILQRLNAVTSELQGTAMRSRMQPVGNLFGKFPRVVRDLGRQLGKQVELTVIGREVELDKTILEQLSDPLTHLIRNCVDHGIEPPEQRRTKRKRPTGQIILRARHEEGQVLIEIQDDGRGIDPQAIRAKALALRLKTEAELNAMSERDIISLILLPGFSTAGQVTEVSGRGVGMDVVKTNLETLEGSLTIDSKLGIGTTMVLRVPLTLAIIPSLIVLVDKERFAIPQRDVEEVVCIHPSLPGRIELSLDTEVYRLRKQLLPIIRMQEVLNRKSAFTPEIRDAIIKSHMEERKAPSKEQYIVVVAHEGRRYGLLVDEVQDTEEIVVKPMQATMKRVRIFNGATIMGDGRVALIANVAGIVNHAQVRLVSDSVEVSAGLPAVRDAAEAHRLLLFESGPEERFALPLLQIRRIVAIRPEQMERTGADEFVVIDGTATRILRLDSILEVSPCEMAPTMHVVLPKYCHEPIGLLISRIVDCDSMTFDLQTSGKAMPGVLGTAIVHDRLTLFLDMHYLHSQFVGTELEPLSATDGHPRKVLLIDDTSFFREAVGRYLSETGISVTTAVDGEDAIQKYASDQFDLIISDIEMPVLDGWQFAKRIRQLGYHGPLMALSSLARADHEGQALACGFDHYEEKLNHDRLIRRVQEILAESCPTAGGST